MGKGQRDESNWPVCYKICFFRGSSPPISRTERGASAELGGGGAELSGQTAASTPFSKTRDKDRWPPRAADNSRVCLTSLHFMLSDGSARESSSGLPVCSCNTPSPHSCWLWGLVSPSTCRQVCGRLPPGSLGASGCGLGVGFEDSGEGSPHPAPSAFPCEETGAHQLRSFAQSRQFREQLGLNELQEAPRLPSAAPATH